MSSEHSKQSKGGRSDSVEGRKEQVGSLSSVKRAYSRPLERQAAQDRKKSRKKRGRTREYTGRPGAVAEEGSVRHALPRRTIRMDGAVRVEVETTKTTTWYPPGLFEGGIPETPPPAGESHMPAAEIRVNHSIPASNLPPRLQSQSRPQVYPVFEPQQMSRPPRRSRRRYRVHGQNDQSFSRSTSRSWSPAERGRPTSGAEGETLLFDQSDDGEGGYGFHSLSSPVVVNVQMNRGEERELQPDPFDLGFTDDMLSTCCRFSLFEEKELRLLDEYKKHVKKWSRRRHIRDTSDRKLFESFRRHRNLRVLFQKFHKQIDIGSLHEPSLFYRMSTRWEPLRWCTLAAVLRERNLIMNEQFMTKELRRAAKDNYRPISEDGMDKPAFVILGWFPKQLLEPLETCVLVEEDRSYFLPDLKKHITALRGWRSLLSFKTVQGFSLYECHPGRFHHDDHPCSPEDQVTLAKLFEATSRSYFRSRALISNGKDLTPENLKHKREESRLWSKWVHQNLNRRRRNSPFGSTLALQLVIKWSKTRIVTAVTIPLLASATIGAWYTWKYEDNGDAWTIAAYVVSVGAAVVAMLAILTTLKDGQAEPKKKVKLSGTSPV